MSSSNTARTERSERALRLRVGRELGRELATASLFLHTLIAGKVGLNATDTRCLDILARSLPASITAGELTKATGLTTGAITGILDRLERAGFVKRTRDADDRRKVLVDLLPGEMAKLTGLYDGLGNSMDALAARYSPKELRMIEGFLSANLAILNQEIARLTETTPPGSPPDR